MFVYEKKLQYPVRIANPNPKLAAFIISQYGGPDGELGASLRYLSQRYTMPYPELKALLTDIGVEELGHLEMVGTIVHQLTRNTVLAHDGGVHAGERFPRGGVLHHHDLGALLAHGAGSIGAGTQNGFQFFVGDLLRFVGAAAAAAPDGLNGLIGHGNFPPVIG